MEDGGGEDIGEGKEEIRMVSGVNGEKEMEDKLQVTEAGLGGEY